MLNGKILLSNQHSMQKAPIHIVVTLLLLSLSLTACLSTGIGGPGSGSQSNAAPPNVVVDVSTSTPSGVNNMLPGATITESSKALFTGTGKQLLRSSLGIMNVQMMGWGAINPEPSPGDYNWQSLDQRVQLMRDSGAVKMITFCCAPDWMKGGDAGSTDWSKLETAPLPEHFDDFAQLAKQVALRYPDVQYFQVWNEMKGFWSDSENRWDYEGYTMLYNKVYDAVKAARPDAKIGGPYVSVASRAIYANANPAEASLDKNALDVISYWLAHKHGADFIALDGGPGPKDNVLSSGVKDEFAAGQFFADVANWVHKQPGAGNLPIGWAEWYPGSEENWRDSNHFNAIMANDLIFTLQSGASYALLWGAQGNRQGIALPQGIMTSQAQETPFYNTAKAFKDFFAPGTQLYTTTISTPDSVAALASATKVLLVNKTDQTLSVAVNSTQTTLTPYQVSVVDI